VNKSDNLAAAYGIAVSATMLMTSTLLLIAMREIWQWSLLASDSGYVVLRRYARRWAKDHGQATAAAWGIRGKAATDSTESGHPIRSKATTQPKLRA
jgi:hypothetical protein